MTGITMEGKHMMEKDIAKVLLSEEQIRERVRALGAQLAEDYRDKNPTMVCILKGAIVFYTDLVRAMPVHLTMDFMAVSSYGNRTKSSGEVEIRKDLSTSIEGKHVVIVEDIVDSGFTLSYLTRLLATRGAKSIRLCTLLDKPPAARRASSSRRITPASRSETNSWWATAGLCRALPQPALYRRAEARGL